MALKSAARIQRAAGRTTDAMLAALPSVASVRPVATLRSSTPFTSSQPIARSTFRSSAASRGLSVKVAAVNGPGLSVDLRGEHRACACRQSSFIRDSCRTLLQFAGKKAFIAGVADDQVGHACTRRRWRNYAAGNWMGKMI